MTPRNYGYDDAAERLGCKRRWLEDNIKRLPHRKFGREVAFSDADLAWIDEHHKVEPPSTGERQEKPADEGRELSLASIRPSGRRRVS